MGAGRTRIFQMGTAFCVDGACSAAVLDDRTKLGRRNGCRSAGGRPKSACTCRPPACQIQADDPAHVSGRPFASAHNCGDSSQRHIAETHRGNASRKLIAETHTWALADESRLRRTEKPRVKKPPGTRFCGRTQGRDEAQGAKRRLLEALCLRSPNAFTGSPAHACVRWHTDPGAWAH